MNIDLVPEASNEFIADIDKLFIHLNKIDSYGKDAIEKNKDMIRLGTPTQYTKKQIASESTSLTIPEKLQIISPNKIEQEGRDIYNKYPELRDLSTVMEHPEFFSFYLKYMRNPIHLKQMLVLMKLYYLIGQYAYKHDPTEEHHNAYHKLVFLYKLIKHPLYSRLFLKRIVPLDAYNNRLMSAN